MLPKKRRKNCRRNSTLPGGPSLAGGKRNTAGKRSQPDGEKGVKSGVSINLSVGRRGKEKGVQAKIMPPPPKEHRLTRAEREKRGGGWGFGGTIINGEPRVRQQEKISSIERRREAGTQSGRNTRTHGGCIGVAAWREGNPVGDRFWGCKRRSRLVLKGYLSDGTLGEKKNPNLLRNPGVKESRRSRNLRVTTEQNRKHPSLLQPTIAGEVKATHIL